MKRIFKKYLARVNDILAITDTQKKTSETRRLGIDVKASFGAGRITPEEEQVLQTLLSMIETDTSEPVTETDEPDANDISKWAAHEVELAIQAEKEASEDSDDWLYGAMCYNSALQAYQMLISDGHSGTSIVYTKSILNRLLDGKCLTPIEDTEDMWNEITWKEGGDHEYQSKRMSSLFKKVTPEGEVTYSDVDRVSCVDIHSPKIAFHSGLAIRVINKLFPITMPYLPTAKPYRIYMEEFMYDKSKPGDFDTVAYYYILMPDGQKMDLNRYFKEDETGQMVPIEKEEFEARKAGKDEKK